MMFRLVRSLLVVLAACAAMAGSHAQGDETLAGTWVIDIPASEESMLRARPFRRESAFRGMPYLGMLFYQFEGDRLTVGTLPVVVGGKKMEYRRAGHGGAAMSYVLVGEQQETVTVVVMNEKNISVTHPSMPEAGFLAWKRVILDPGKTTPNDYGPEIEAYMSFLERLMKAFGFFQR